MPVVPAHPLLPPLLAMVALTLLVWIRLYAVRLPEMRRSRIDPQQLAGSADKHLLKDTRASDNFINLFEVPVLFYVLVLATVSAGVQDPVLVGLRPTVERHDLDAGPFHDLVRANLQDQVVTRYPTYAELRDYCRLSADPVGRIVLGLFGQLDDERAALSDQVCTALQLVEHWQDVG